MNGCLKTKLLCDGGGYASLRPEFGGRYVSLSPNFGGGGYVPLLPYCGGGGGGGGGYASLLPGGGGGGGYASLLPGGGGGGGGGF